MKFLKVSALCLFSLAMVSCLGQQAQAQYPWTSDQTREEFVASTLPLEEGSVAQCINPMKWGNPKAGDKLLYLYAAPDKHIMDEGNDYYLDGPLLMMVMEQQADGLYLPFATDTIAHEILIGTYPRTAFIDSAATADLDGDGALECIIRVNGSMRCEVELEEEDPETGEMITFTTTATCDYVEFGILRQENKQGHWELSFSVEFAQEGSDDRYYGGPQIFPDFIRSYQR